MSLRKDTEARLRAAGLVLTKLRGQHFLVDERVLAVIVAASGVKKGEHVLEIGPGAGVLTQALVAVGVQVTAVEIDPRFSALLRTELGSAAEIVEGDALAVCNQRGFLTGLGKYQVIANLPYQITNPFLWQMLDTKQTHPPQSLTLLVQKEVAERMAAGRKKTERMNLLAVLVQSFGTVEIIRQVSPQAFLPPPRVDSAVIHIRRTEHVGDRAFLLRLARAGFASPRRTLASNLVNARLFLSREAVESALLELHLPPKVRAEALAVKDWVALCRFCTGNS